MTDSTVTGDAVQAVADLTRAAEQAKTIPWEESDAGLVVRVVDQDQRVEVIDMERTLTEPLLARGGATVHEPDSFTTYLKRNLTDATTVWADDERGTVTAVFDDHSTEHGPRWREHTAQLVLQPDPEWQAWVARSGQLGTQEGFAEFIEDHLMSITNPDPATMLEVSTTFQAAPNVSFERGTRLATGEVQLRYVEELKATAGRTGTLEIPEKFTVSVAPYLGVNLVDLEARLRYRVREGELRIGFQLHRPDLHQRQAFNNVVAHVLANTTAPVLIGQAPTSLRERRSATTR